LVVGSEAFPFDGGVGIFEESFEEFFVEVFAVRTVGMMRIAILGSSKRIVSRI
jgi:hypothetical protein